MGEKGAQLPTLTTSRAPFCDAPSPTLKVLAAVGSSLAHPLGEKIAPRTYLGMSPAQGLTAGCGG